MIEDHQLRDCQAWREDNVELGTTSNEAAKMFDLALHQYTGWYENKKHGGMHGTLDKLRKADPNFILGKVFALECELLGTGKTIRANQELAKSLDALKKEVERKSNASFLERLHVQGLDEWAHGRQSQAAATWERILLDHPQDILALKLAYDTYFYFGKFPQQRDCVARVMPEYHKSSSYYGYLRGMYAFGLEETNLYREAEKYALQALEHNKNDGWASHALTHVYEMEGKYDEGEMFVSSTKKDWIVCGALATHLHWHWCLMLMEQGRYDEVLEFYDSYMHGHACTTKSMLDLVDTTSLLYRLQLEDVNVGGRWKDIYEICRPHMDDHITAFNDIHILFSLCGLKKADEADKQLKGLVEYANTTQEENSSICRSLGIDMYKAVKAYEWGNYKEAVELLMPIRYDIVRIGGSAAQRDVLHQILIHAAMKSPVPEHSKLAKSLLYERKAIKENSPLTDRLMAKLLSSHINLNNAPSNK